MVSPLGTPSAGASGQTPEQAGLPHLVTGQLARPVVGPEGPGARAGVPCLAPQTCAGGKDGGGGGIWPEDNRSSRNSPAPGWPSLVVQAGVGTRAGGQELHRDRRWWTTATCSLHSFSVGMPHNSAPSHYL